MHEQAIALPAANNKRQTIESRVNMATLVPQSHATNRTDFAASTSTGSAPRNGRTGRQHDLPTAASEVEKVDFWIGDPSIRKDMVRRWSMSTEPPCPSDISHFCHRPYFISTMTWV